MKHQKHANILVVLAASLVLALPPAGHAQFTYTINAYDTNTITITGYTGSGGNVTIPSTINGWSVTIIGDWAFKDCYSLTSVTIPDSVTSIGADAFYWCDGLTNVTIGGNVISIGNSSFIACLSLTSVVIPDSVTSIGNLAFNSCYDLTGVLIGNSVTNIGNDAFEYCYGLTSVMIPDNVISIGNYAFHSCYGLTNVAIGDSVTSMGYAVFSSCSNLVSVNIPNSVTSMGSGAFSECYGLTNVTIGNSLTNIGTSVFYYCTNLRQAYFQGNAPLVNGGPGSADTTVFQGEDGTVYYVLGTTDWGTTFGGWPTAALNNPAADFTYATNNGTITITGYTGLGGNVAIPSIINGYPVASIGTNALANISTLTSVIIPDSVTRIGADAFYWCDGLTNVTIGNSVSRIGEEAFYACSGLASVSIPNSVTNIGDWAFAECLCLTSVTIGNRVISIGEDSFEDCFSLTSVTIPNAVTSIGDWTFDLCSGLTNIIVDAANSSYASAGGVLFNKAMTTLVVFPGGLAGGYVIPNGVTCIGNWAFEDCSGLASIIIPNSVTNIGTYAFDYCASLHQAYFQGNAPSVNGDAGSADSTVFQGETGTVYYVPGTSGWSATFGGWPAAGWYQPQPQILGSGYGLGAQNNGFRFTISWATNTSVVVEASTNLLNWMPVITNTLVNGTNAFGDSNWTRYRERFYRVRSP